MMTRRTVLAGAALAAGAAPDPGPVWQFEMPSLDEGTLRFADYRGKVLLLVNTASFCGFTPQYRQLEALHRDLEPRGFAVIGVPSQDFGQEMGSNGEVKEFCELTYGVDFPMTAISHVRGPEAVPLYRWVKTQTQWEPRWNFFKVLIGRNGAVIGTFGSDAEPDRAPLKLAIAAAVAA